MGRGVTKRGKLAAASAKASGSLCNSADALRRTKRNDDSFHFTGAILGSQIKACRQPQACCRSCDRRRHGT